jgi:hypothetical protein
MACENLIMKRISIANNFSDTPVGRYPDDDDFCGQNFRKNILEPALANGAHVEVDIGGTEGYGSSFLEEAFGGLVRHNVASAKDLRNRLSIICSTTRLKMFVPVIWKYIEEEQSRKDREA